jgi:hypothetical protein
MSPTPTLSAVSRAIQVRNVERMSVGGEPITEMTLPRETYDRLMSEVVSMCLYQGEPQEHPTCMNVIIRRMGDG